MNIQPDHDSQAGGAAAARAIRLAPPVLLMLVSLALPTTGRSWLWIAQLQVITAAALVLAHVLRRQLSGSRGLAGVCLLRDNGVGFAAEDAAQLFVPFTRLNTAVRFAGTGVGLAIALRIVERHHGRIWAEAELGRGATFCFTLTPPQSLV